MNQSPCHAVCRARLEPEVQGGQVHPRKGASRRSPRISRERTACTTRAWLVARRSRALTPRPRAAGQDLQGALALPLRLIRPRPSSDAQPLPHDAGQQVVDRRRRPRRRRVSGTSARECNVREFSIDERAQTASESRKLDLESGHRCSSLAERQERQRECQASCALSSAMHDALGRTAPTLRRSSSRVGRLLARSHLARSRTLDPEKAQTERRTASFRVAAT